MEITLGFKVSSVGEFLRLMRVVKRQESLRKFAKRIGISHPHLADIERNKASVPLRRLSEFVKHYNLSKEEKEVLRKLIIENHLQF